MIYLGYKISQNGIKPDHEKTNCVKNVPTPYNQTTVKSFIGLINYYRKFIPNFAQIAKPYDTIVKKDFIFV